MKVYISGPITGTNDYMERFEKAEEELREEGHVVVNPAKVNSNMPEESTHEDYMRVSLAMMEMCEVVYFLKDWEESRGCLEEFKYAVEHKMVITFEGGRG